MLIRQYFEKIAKGAHNMSVDSERITTRKAMIYDLRIILKETHGLDPATIDTVIKIMDDYIVADIANEK